MFSVLKLSDNTIFPRNRNENEDKSYVYDNFQTKDRVVQIPQKKIELI